MWTKNGETADFERDPNQGSLSVEDLDKSKKPSSPSKETASREIRFLLNELQQIKEQVYQKLILFKSRTKGKRTSQGELRASIPNQFEIK